MGLPELKQKIQMQIENADERLLRIVSSVFDNYLNEDSSDNTTQNSMTVPEKKAIDEALIQVANKQTIPHDLVMEETKKRYPKYFKNEN
jgi:DNA polymerase IIIc chi subunit